MEKSSLWYLVLYTSHETPTMQDCPRSPYYNSCPEGLSNLVDDSVEYYDTLLCKSTPTNQPQVHEL